MSTCEFMILYSRHLYALCIYMKFSPTKSKKKKRVSVKNFTVHIRTVKSSE